MWFFVEGVGDCVVFVFILSGDVCIVVVDEDDVVDVDVVECVFARVFCFDLIVVLNDDGVVYDVWVWCVSELDDVLIVFVLMMVCVKLSVYCVGVELSEVEAVVFSRASTSTSYDVDVYDVYLMLMLLKDWVEW